LSPAKGVIDQAFILAAGYGTRLRPLTDLIPKPLLPLANRPLLELLLDHLDRLGIGRVGINVHHLAGRMEEFLETRRGGPEITLFREKEILGTGGGLGQAWGSFGREPCLVINGDVAFDLDLAAILEAHQEAVRSRKAAVTMVLHHLPGLNQVLTLGERIIGFREDEPPAGAERTRRLAYTCVQVVEPVVFDYLPRSSPGGLITAYRRMIADGRLLRAHILEEGGLWSDIGRLADYLGLHRQVLAKGREVLGRRFAGPVLLAQGARLEEGVEVEGFACLGPGAWAGAGARLAEAVVMAGARVGPGAVVERGVIGPGARFEGELKDGVFLDQAGLTCFKKPRCGKG